MWEVHKLFINHNLVTYINHVLGIKNITVLHIDKIIRNGKVKVR